MAQRKRGGERGARKEPRSIRAPVSLQPGTYRTLEALAKQKRVSTAWVLRDPAEKIHRRTVAAAGGGRCWW
jgi:hypothetical protein